MSVKRWWNELRNPEAKCARVGHSMRDREVEVIYWPARGMRSLSVATKAVEITPTCARCGHAEPMRVEIERHLTSITLPSANMRLLRRVGRIEV